jgi:hypothetical protein
MVTIAAMQARSRFSLALCLAAAALLGGCAGMDAQECRDTDWAYLGQLDAMDGRLDLSTRARRHFKACKDQGVQMDARAYQQGWLRGLQDFCTPKAARPMRKPASKFQLGYCPAPLEAAFLQGYAPARERYQDRQSVLELERRIEAKKKSCARRVTPRTVPDISPMSRKTCVICSWSWCSSGSSWHSRGRDAAGWRRDFQENIMCGSELHALPEGVQRVSRFAGCRSSACAADAGRRGAYRPGGSRSAQHSGRAGGQEHHLQAQERWRGRAGRDLGRQACR